jgi:hypothetical protein
MDMQIPSQLMIIIAIMGLMVLIGIVIIIIRMRSAMGARNIWAQLGYHPIAGDTRVALGKQTSHFVRDYKGVQIHYLSSHKSGFGKMQMSVSWVCSLPQETQNGFQVVEASLAEDSTMARVSRSLDRYKYNWQPRFTQRMQTGDTQFDSRFAIFGSHPEKSLLALTDPAMREALLSLKHVDLSVAGSEARFEDPFYVNQWNLSGSALGEVHNKIAFILARVSTIASQV